MYTKLDSSDELIAEGKITHQIDDVDDLKRVVFSENDNQLPGCKATNLHVYPPGTTDYRIQFECRG